MTISAIITTRNYESFIAGAIESVLRQTRVPDEIIVVDDGSTDNTAEIVAAYVPRGVRYISKPAGGASSARNRGIQESHGDLLAFLDADDRWLPEKTARQVEHLRKHPSAGLVTASELQVYQSGKRPMKVCRKPVGAAFLYPQLLVENVVGNPSLTLIRRECFEKAGLFDEDIGLGQDWDMWLRIARRYPIGVVDAVLIHFQRHEGSLTSGRTWARYAANRRMHRRYISRVRAPLRRLGLWSAAESMNAFYAAASLVNDPAARVAALRLALTATLLDPAYKSRLKLALLFHAAVGDPAFERLSRLVRGRRGP